jgi:hypothetical protein
MLETDYKIRRLIVLSLSEDINEVAAPQFRHSIGLW